RDKLAYFRDDLDASIRGAREAYELAVQVPNRTVQGGSAGTLASVYLLRGEYAEAKRWVERSLAMARSIGNTGMCRTIAAVGVLVHVELGEPPPPAYAELIGGEPTGGSEVSMSSHVIVDALLALGDVDTAERYARYATAHAAGRLREMLSALALGNVLLRLGPQQWSEAERAFSSATALAEALGSRAVQAAARLGAGELAALRGERLVSARHLQHALTLTRALKLGRYQPRVEALLREVGGGVSPAADQAVPG